MGAWVYIRGWLEFAADAQKRSFKRIVGDAPEPGWAFPEGGWLNAACYARAVRAQYVDEVLDVIRQAAALPGDDIDGDRVRGLFLAYHEIDGQTEWRVRDGQVIIGPAGERYDYLNE
ncbi:hypothetical protein [Nonomuraea sp. NPDC003201]